MRRARIFLVPSILVSVLFSGFLLFLNKTHASTSRKLSGRHFRWKYLTLSELKQNEGEAFWVETGVASWYGKKFHGRRTANEEIYDMHSLTAAHRHIPFNTLVRVTNLANGKSVVVRINDRGPSVRSRIVDLSYVAARQLEMVKKGVVKVKLEVLPNLFYWETDYEWRETKFLQKNLVSE